MLLSFSLREDAAAIILSVEFILFGQLDGPLVASALLEVGGEEADSVFFSHFIADFVQSRGILEGTDRQGGGEVVEPFFSR